ncbi:MAG: 30S ribosomal protein S12 methylthiotransferase RimO [candidate division WOR-3 bacterium]|nr:30S ribosomal protein S12 methylthiotransferase RimO [candidate division WOR-3 bacterium]MCX7947475.1 30S ribosomal protein S12 methylthiotransferase RimO [candidate division WOR-3 bacterium]MDW8150634.1 30S ribosomal protein S12 methylthiotransferase RimO [candidate division WOR-3 bacterium]
MPKKTYKIVNLGCPKNLVDSEIIMGLMEGANYKFSENPQIVIINTCGFLSSAIEESKAEILSYLEKKKKGKVEKVVVAGCLVQRKKNEILQELKDVDLFIGHDDIPNIVDLIEGRLKPRIFENPRYIPSSKLPRAITTNYYAYVKIGEGCSRRCSFCVIPSIRGNFRSRPIEDIVSEIKELARLNIKEVVLVAQDITLYGYDLYGKFSLLELIEEINKIDNISWFRLLYVHPYGISKNEEIVKNLANSKFVPYLELPIQHINDRILKLMNRSGGKRAILKALEIIDKYFKDYTLRTEIIVGFPSETNSEFEELMDFIENSLFSRIGVFPYYREEGTSSYYIDEQLDEETKNERYEIAREIAFRKFLEFQNSLVGRELDVLVEYYEKGYFYGRSVYDAPNVDGSVVLKGVYKPGEIYKVNITSVNELGDLVC